MGQTIVAKGKTVKEAVSVALELLNVGKNEVNIEILENERKGVLGLASKPAVVRVTLKSMEPDLARALDRLEDAVSLMDFSQQGSMPSSASLKIQPPKLSDKDRGGKVWITDGIIFCKDAPDSFPLIAPNKEIELYKNGFLVERTVIVSEDDVLEVKIQNEVCEPDWSIELSDDKMEAFLKVSPGYTIHTRLKDKPPSNYVQLEVNQSKTFTLIQSGLIMEKLKELGIEHGIDLFEIARACTSEEAGSFVIAKGTPPTPGKHGWFKPVQQIEIKKGLKERSDGTIDYREIREFPSVDRGQVIGGILPPEPGYPGMNVLNELVLPPEVYPVSVNAGRGVEIVDETTCVATESGQPEIIIIGQLVKILVVSKLLIGSDVSLQTGNIRYIGDVEILGSVQDGMTVEAQGTLVVRHNVNVSKICTGGSIIVHNNIIASEVTAGKSTFLKAELAQIMGELIEQLKQIVIAIHQLSAVSAFKVTTFTQTGLGPLIKILCEGKFKTFPALVNTLAKKVRDGNDLLEADWGDFSKRLHNDFITFQFSSLKSVEDVDKMIKIAEELYDSAQDTGEDERRFIKTGFIQNSQLYSSGDIIITDQGVYNSKLYAGGYIEVAGFVRGGDMYAAKGVRIREAGARGGSMTKFTVPAGGSITIDLALEDTVIQIGNKMHKFLVQTGQVRARLDQSGNIIFI